MWHLMAGWRRLHGTFVFAAAVTSPVVAFAVQTYERDTVWVAPPEQASRVNPLASRTDISAGGAKLFRHRCRGCHGDAGRGSSKAPDLTTSDVQSQSDGSLFWKISSGNTHEGMPAFSFLPEPQRWQLVMYVRKLAPMSSR